jgi:acyl-CoA reductase-like NAD-dependent aldehyde dehydrogenase
MEVRAQAMLIGPDWEQSRAGGQFEDRSPTTGELIAALPSATAEDVDRAVAAAREAQPGWSRIGGEKRGRLLAKLAERLEEEQDRISELESIDNGRPRRETASQARIVARWYRYFGGMADKVTGETIPVEGPYLNYTKRVPVGVCGAITPWNHPLLIATKKVAPALACGNAVVVKPSELAPLSVLELGRLAQEVGFPPGVLNIVLGSHQAGEALTVNPAVDRIDVTGSTATGIAVARAAAPTMKRLGLELGGKAANIIFADAEPERALQGALFAGFIAQGQSCVAGARALVERSIAEAFASRLSERLDRITVGDPLDRDTQMGPLITPQAAERVRGCVADAVAHGAILRAGGGVPDDLPSGVSPGGFCEPTLLWTDDHMIGAAQEEIFGPVVTLIPFDDEETAVEIANEVPFGLGAGVWTRDVARAHRVADAVRAGIVWVNDYHRIDPASPWGGFGLSGYGRENGFDAVLEFTETKSTWVAVQEQPIDWYESNRFDLRLN